jgi:hypothetical protein
MSQRTTSINEDFVIELKFKVNIISFSNHNGFFHGQIDKAIEEFKEVIKEEIECNINGVYQQQEFLQTTDFVSYEIINLK